MAKVRPFEKAAVSLAAALSLAMLLFTAAYAQSQPVGAPVSGRVVNGTAGGPVPSDVTVVLEVFSPDRSSASYMITTDAEGRFSFPAVSLDAIQYRLSAAYQGVSYRLDVDPAADLTSLSVHVYDTTSSMEQITIPTSSMLVIGADAQSGKLAFMELAQVKNNGDRTFVPDLAAGGMGFLRFPLPPAAEDLEIESELPEGQAIQVDRGFGVTTPVPPGEYSIAFSYTAPYVGNTFNLPRTFLLGTGRFRALVPQSLGKVTATDAQVKGETSIGGVAFWLLEAESIPPGGSLSFVIRGLPQPGLWQRASSILGGDASVLVAPALLAAGLGLLLVIGARRKMGTVPLALSPAPTDRDGLLQAVASLDDRYERGEVAEEAYDQARGLLMGRLLREAWLEESKAGPRRGLP
ncbi:MAG: carboxypeptidase regulatory-like domain-containing protein [Chloroflexi bacterium]|nr:carboxypeptidase regulatory-like domain-containing protein [Chloroflexota bacterium]